MRRLVSCSLALVTGLVAARAIADDRKFTYSTEATTLPKGVWEFEQWATLQEEKNSGHWHEFLFREELEYGITDRLNASFYVNSSFQDVSGVQGFEDEHSAGFDSNSLELKYKLSDPSADVVGSLLYGELLLSDDEYDLEGKAVFSKQVGSWTFAYNFVWEAVLEKSDDPLASPEWTWEHEISNTLGASLGLTPSFNVGVEAFDVSRYQRSLDGESTHAYYLGPNVHYSGETWWATLTLVRQLNIEGLDFTDEDNTKYGLRLIVGVNF
jgi:uncharacterized protein DUF6662